MSGDAIFLLEQKQSLAGKTAGNFQSDAKPHHTTADNDYVTTGICHGFLISLGRDD
jgi:hypothetical protein